MAPKKQYTQEQMMQAIKDVERGVSIASAAKNNGVPFTTLNYKVRGKLPTECTMGPPSVLTPKEEQVLVQWIIELGKIHYPITKFQLFDSVEHIVKKSQRITPFKNHRPGEKWYKAFLRRNPEISERISQNLTVSRENVTEHQIRQWFLEIKNYLIKENVLEVTSNPQRVFNADESAFYLQPKGDKVLTKKGDKNVYSVGGDEKENITVLVTANAAGKFVPPMVLFNYQRIPSYISCSIPKQWAIGTSENGWMCGSTFYEYITNIFVPWIETENIERPVLLFVDGHVSHMTLHLSDYCSNNGIILISLFPNSTHLIQPMDVSVFRPLKQLYKNEVHKWRLENSGNKLHKGFFGPVFERALNSVSEETIKSGFRVSGLCPFDVESVKFTKISKENTSHPDNQADNIKANVLLKEIEKRVNKEKIDLFRTSLPKPAWDGHIEDTSLFELWKKLFEEVNKNKNNHQTEEEVQPSIVNDRIIEENNDVSQNEQAITKEPVDKPELESFPSTSKINSELSSPQKEDMTMKQNKAQSNLPIDVPSPFKGALFWPDTPNSNKKRKLKERIPSVVTSQAWQEYHRKKDEQKKKKIAEKENRAKLRELKKNEKLKEKKEKI